jgi:hypothetical protein
MNHKSLRNAALAIMIGSGAGVGLVPSQVRAEDESVHMGDLSARVDKLEAQVRSLEAASNRQSGMMEHMMKHKQPMSDHDMGGAMGTMPPAGAAPAGGMGGDM